MKYLRSRIIATTLALAVVAGLGACTSMTSSSMSGGCEPDHTFPTVKEGTLTVGMTEIPPFSYSRNGEPAGSDVDIAKEFAAANCLEVDFESIEYSAAVPSVKNERRDMVIGDFYRTQERSEIVGLSAPLYLDELGVVAEEEITTVDQLEGKVVGTVAGYLWVEDMRALLGDDLNVYSSSVELRVELDAGRLDVAADALGTVVFLFEDSDYQISTLEPDEAIESTVQPAQSTFPHVKGNTELGQALDAAIEELHSSGRMVEILEANGLQASSADVGEPRLIG